MNLPKLPDPVVTIKGTITRKDGTVVPFELTSQESTEEIKKDGTDTDDSRS